MAPRTKNGTASSSTTTTTKTKSKPAEPVLTLKLQAEPEPAPKEKEAEKEKEKQPAKPRSRAGKKKAPKTSEDGESTKRTVAGKAVLREYSSMFGTQRCVPTGAIVALQKALENEAVYMLAKIIRKLARRKVRRTTISAQMIKDLLK
jgi:hypothetical protein